MNKITLAEIEKWRESELKRGINSATINRATTTIKSVLNRAVKEKTILVTPLQGIEKLSGVSDGIVRYLGQHDENEGKRLLEILKGYSGNFPCWLSCY